MASASTPDPSEQIAEGAYKRIIASTTKPDEVPKIIEDAIKSTPQNLVIEVKRRTKEKLILAEQTSEKHNDNVKKALDVLKRQ